MLLLFMAAVEITVVATAMPTVVRDLGGLSLYSWVFSGYLLAATVSVPIYGKLADLFGRKPILMTGIALFTSGSAACAASVGMQQLILFRILQGLGAGAIQPVALTVVGDIFTLEERAKMQGLFGSVWGLAGLVGPMLGATIVQSLGWRGIFLVNVPCGVAAAVLLQKSLIERLAKKRHSLDIAGALVLVASVLAVLLAAQRLWPLFMACGAAMGFAALLWLEQHAKEPMIPIGLFRNPVITVACACGLIASGVLFGFETFLPLYVQVVLGASPLVAGSLLTPTAVAWSVAGTLGGRLIPRFGFRPFVQSGLLLIASCGLALPLVAQARCGVLAYAIVTTGFGIGFGLSFTALLIAVQTSVMWDQRGVATASSMFFRTIGGTIAVGVMGGVLASAVSEQLTSSLLGQAHRAIPEAVLAGVTDRLDAGMLTIFWIIGALGVAAFASSLAFPSEVPSAAIIPRSDCP